MWIFGFLAALFLDLRDAIWDAPSSLGFWLVSFLLLVIAGMWWLAY